MTIFNGETVFITGGSRGIGHGIAERFSADKAKVAIIDIDEEALEEARHYFSDEDVLVINADVTKRDEVEAAMKKTYETFGSIDILVNNAGVIHDNMLFKMTEHDWQTVMDVHLKGSFNAASVAQRFMVQQKYGRIINISSTSALGNRGQANYSTAKAGLQGFTKTLAIELGKFGITTNCIAPGFIETDMTRATAERVGITFTELMETAISKIPMARIGHPEDIANAAAFLADERSSFVNGQVIYVAGGPKV